MTLAVNEISVKEYSIEGHYFRPTGFNFTVFFSLFDRIP
jgi:hypothetical protein